MNVNMEEHCMQNGIEIKNISKDFSGKQALKNISLSIEEGAIHSIVGENGAGKSTLMSILGGVLRPTEGEVFIDGKKLMTGKPQVASLEGIGMVFQHFMLVPTLSVWQNIILGSEPLKKFLKVDKKNAIRKIEDVCKTYEFHVNLEQLVGELPVGQQQKVEILKVLYKDAKYIVLDEPTAVLIPEETKMLFASMRALKAAGKTVIFISHKLQEVLEVSDQISVLKNGELVGTVNASETNSNELVKMMVGHEINMEGMPLKTNKGKELVQAESVFVEKKGFFCGLNDISFCIREGEILGIAGVDGNGQGELLDTLLCLTRPKSGRIIKEGIDVTGCTNAVLRKQGVACIPPDRHHQGVVLDSGIKYNLILGCEEHPEISSGPFINNNKLDKLTEKMCAEYNIKMSNIEEPIRDLSGGNQQKVILARECGVRDTNVIFAVNPTRGLDIGAMEFVYKMLEENKKQGKAILLISTELSEIMRLSDRIAVLYKGQIMDTIDRDKATVKRIGALMAGLSEGV